MAGIRTRVRGRRINWHEASRAEQSELLSAVTIAREAILAKHRTQGFMVSLIINNPEEYARSHAPLSDTEAAMPSARPGSVFGHAEDVCR